MPEPSAPAAVSREREAQQLQKSAQPLANASSETPARGCGDNVVLVEVHHYHEVPQEGICCPLMVFILGFSMPALWIFGCCYLSSRNPTIRLLGRASIIALGISLMTGVIVTFHIWAKSGKWPWS